MIFDKFKELKEIKDLKGISFYSNINLPSNKNELISFLKRELENLSKRVKKEESNYFNESKKNLIEHVEEIRIKGRSVFIFSTPKKVYEYFYDFPLRSDVYFGLANFYQFYWAIYEHQDFGIVSISLENLEYRKYSLFKEVEIITTEPSIDTSDWRRKHIMPPSAPKEGVSVGAVGGGNLKDAFEEKFDLHFLKILKEFKSNILKSSQNLKYIFVTSSSLENIDNFLNLEPISNVFYKLITPSNATKQDIFNLSIEKIGELREKEEKILLNELLNRASTSNLGAIGLTPSLKFIQDGRVNKILFSENLKKSVNICKNCSYIFFEKDYCPSCNSKNYDVDDLKYHLHLLGEKFKSELYILHGTNAKTLDLNGEIGVLLRY